MILGPRLTALREQRGKTLPQIAGATRISIATLRNIEAGQLERLPGGILGRGCLRAYAAEIGPEAQQLVETHLAEVAIEVPPPPVPAAPAWGPLVAVAVGSAAVATVIIRVLLVSAAPEAAPDVVMRSPMPAVAPLVAPVVMRDPAGIPTAAGLEVEVEVTGPCWIAAMADGEMVVSRRLEQGDTFILTADERLEIRVGDPQMFRYTINGRHGRRLGPAGVPATLDITPDNYEALVQPTLAGTS